MNYKLTSSLFSFAIRHLAFVIPMASAIPKAFVIPKSFAICTLSFAILLAGCEVFPPGATGALGDPCDEKGRCNDGLQCDEVAWRCVDPNAVDGDVEDSGEVDEPTPTDGDEEFDDDASALPKDHYGADGLSPGGMIRMTGARHSLTGGFSSGLGNTKLKGARFTIEAGRVR